jgi:GDPmannose 4,6-dehydratase
VEAAFSHVGLKAADHVVSDAQFLRPTAVPCLAADASKARRELNWQPRVGFAELVHLMVETDLERVAKEKRQGLKQAG